MLTSITTISTAMLMNMVILILTNVGAAVTQTPTMGVRSSKPWKGEQIIGSLPESGGRIKLCLCSD